MSGAISFTLTANSTAAATGCEMQLETAAAKCPCSLRRN